MKYLQYINTGILALLIVVVGYGILNPTPPQITYIEVETLGARNAVGGKSYKLGGSGVSASQSTIDLTKFEIAGGTQKLRIADFGDLGCGTFEPGHTTKQEFISFTGVTQNSDGTAQLTGVTRGLSPVPTYTASTTLRTAHAGGSTFVLSNSPPCFFEGYANITQPESIINIWTFDADEPPTLDATGKTATSSAQLISKEYAEDLAIAGAPDGSLTVKGIYEKARTQEAASSSADGSGNTTAPLALTTSIATSTPDVHPATATSSVVVTEHGGRLSNLFFDLVNDLWNWTAGKISIGTTTPGRDFSVQGTGLFSGTTSVATLYASSSMNIGGQKYNWRPATASTTALLTDAVGNLSWGSITETKVFISAGAMASSTGSIMTSSTLITPYYNMGDLKDTSAGATAKAPLGTTGLSGINILYYADATGNVFQKFFVSGTDMDSFPSNPTIDTSDSDAAYAGGSADQDIRAHAVPSAAFDSIGTIDAGDLVSININRNGASASDTYGVDYRVIGVEFTFN